MPTDDSETAGNLIPEFQTDPDTFSRKVVWDAMQFVQQQNGDRPENIVPIAIGRALKENLEEAANSFEEALDYDGNLAYVNLFIDVQPGRYLGQLYIDVPVNGPFDWAAVQDHLSDLAEACNLQRNVSEEVDPTRSKAGVESQRVIYEIPEGDIYESVFEEIYSSNQEIER